MRMRSSISTEKLRAVLKPKESAVAATSFCTALGTHLPLYCPVYVDFRILGGRERTSSELCWLLRRITFLRALTR